MSPITSRFARLVFAGCAALTFAAAPIAAADPEDDVPVCSGGQSPEYDACRTPCPEGAPLNFDGTCGEPVTEGGSAEGF